MQHQRAARISKQHRIAEARMFPVQGLDHDVIVVAQPRRHADAAYPEAHLHSVPKQILDEFGQEQVGGPGHRRAGNSRRHQAAAEKSSSTEARSLACGRKASS